MVTWHHLSWVLIPLLFAGSGSLADPGATSAIRGRQDSAVGEVERHSLKEIRDRYVVKQQLDYSCGAAALATLLTYYFGDPTAENDVMELLVTELTKDERQLKAWRGFSLLDLKHIAQAKGYRAAGFKLTIEHLMQLAAPVIVFVQPLGYPHFAVLRGIDRGRVYLADPREGTSV